MIVVELCVIAVIINYSYSFQLLSSLENMGNFSLLFARVSISLVYVTDSDTTVVSLISDTVDTTVPLLAN